MAVVPVSPSRPCGVGVVLPLPVVPGLDELQGKESTLEALQYKQATFFIMNKVGLSPIFGHFPHWWVWSL